MLKVEIDPGSGFCGGVIRAIGRAEDCLAQGRKLYSLGAIVHNEAELNRLEQSGLVTVKGLDQVPDGEAVLIRAHGEPPATYQAAEKRQLSVIDCTCPVVLQLQRRIRETYVRMHQGGRHGQIILFGRVGHAEVLGLLGQVDGDALVIENTAMLEQAEKEGLIDYSQPMEIFSQTTKSPAEFDEICRILQEKGAHVTIHDTICAQVAGRHQRLAEFARAHDIIVFVAGRSSSNGKVLSDLCRAANPRTYLVGSAKELSPEWFRPGDSVGVCGATSTPKWLLEQVAAAAKVIQPQG